MALREESSSILIVVGSHPDAYEEELGLVVHKVFDLISLRYRRV